MDPEPGPSTTGNYSLPLTFFGYAIPDNYTLPLAILYQHSRDEMDPKLGPSITAITLYLWQFGLTFYAQQLHSTLSFWVIIVCAIPPGYTTRMRSEPPAKAHAWGLEYCK